MSERQTRRRYCRICAAEVDMPADLFAGMEEAPRLIARAFREPRGHDRSGGWSPVEIAAHLADIEVAFGWRIRQVLAVEVPELQAFDQEAWAGALHYPRRQLAVSLAAYGANRQLNLELLRGAGETGMARNFQHPEFGRLPLGELVEHIADHDLEHLRQILRA